MGNLGTKIAQDIRNRFNSGEFTKKVVEPSSDIHISSIRKLSKQGKDASGGDFFPLNEPYAKDKQEQGGSGIADLYSADSSEHALDDMYATSQDKGFDLEFKSAHQEDYMGAHYEGSRARGDFGDMPVRKWFPTENDMSKPPQQRNIEQIEKIIERYINEDRTIRVKGKVT